MRDKSLRRYRKRAAPQKRIAKFRAGMQELKNSMAVLIGFAHSDDGELALRRATRPPTVPLDPENVGAPPTTAEVADEVGRPKAAVNRQPAHAALQPH